MEVLVVGVYSLGQRERVLELLEAGWSGLSVAAAVGVNRMAVSRWAKDAGMRMRMGPVGGLLTKDAAGGARPEPGLGGQWRDGQWRDGLWRDGRGQLTEAGRALIMIRLGEGRSAAAIAAELGMHRSSVSRELARARVAGVYSARAAQARAVAARARPQPRKLDRPEHALLRRQVIAGLVQRWSPQQIAGHLRAHVAAEGTGQDGAMTVSHETIYQALYVQGRGSLRQELARDLAQEKILRSGRTRRLPASRLAARPKGKSWVGTATISARPAEATDRAVPGHWEGDLVIGARGASALITLVERSTRYLLMARLHRAHDSATVTDRLTSMVATLPVHLRKTLTWDQGPEMSEHARFTVATEVRVFFADPHSPWQRGSNENTNGLIRQFFPKGTDFATVTDQDVAKVEHLLNTRPRETLGFHTPASRLNELLTVAPTG